MKITVVTVPSRCHWPLGAGRSLIEFVFWQTLGQQIDRYMYEVVDTTHETLGERGHACTYTNPYPFPLQEIATALSE